MIALCVCVFRQEILEKISKLQLIISSKVNYFKNIFIKTFIFSLQKKLT